MLAAELASLERLFGITLPSAYMEFMLRFPKVLRTTKRDFGWKQEAISERELVESPEALRGLNELVRMPDTPWGADGSPWPEAHFVIGDDECGNYYSLDTRDRADVVWFYDHDYGTWRHEADSVAQFARILLEEAAKGV